MELILKRTVFTNDSTIGELSINGVFDCFILEDKDRGLTSAMSEDEIKKIKIHSVTAIPYGKYETVMTFSNRFQKYLPLLLGVKGFEGIRIHTGNKATDSEGCLITGTQKGDNMVSQSKTAFDKLIAKIKSVEKVEKIFITITK